MPSDKKNNLLGLGVLDQLLRRDREAAGVPGDDRRRRIFIAAAALWFFACLAWGAPAQLMASLLGKAVPQLELQAPEGSFWHGRAGAAFWRQGEQRFALGTLEWQLSPWSLLWLHPGVHLSANYGEQFLDTRARLSPLGGLQLRDLRAALPVAALTQQLPMRTDGLVGLRFERVEIGRGQRIREVRGEVQWQRAAWEWNTRWIALGDYVCTLSTSKSGELQAKLEGKGALAATGEATANLEDRSYKLQLTLVPAASLPQELRDGIGVVLGGQRDAQGHWRIDRDGKW